MELKNIDPTMNYILTVKEPNWMNKEDNRT
jgi:hypothetical protein